MSSPQALVFAVCHEVGNLLAAIRLHGDLRDPDSGRKVAELSARSGSLLSLVRPLLDESAFEPITIEPGRLLEGLRGGLDDPQDPRLELDAGEAAKAPPVLVDGEVMHHLLLCELLAAFERLQLGERLRVGLRPEGDRLVFELSGGAPELEPVADDRLAGRSLCHALARDLLARGGGTVHAGPCEGRQRVEFELPLA